MSKSTNKTYKVGTRVFVNITDTFKPTATIVFAQSNRCVVKFDDAKWSNCICRYSELTPISE